ncbi:MAG: hypothetical protein AAF358_11560 [Pseudomonadota bacterium]
MKTYSIRAKSNTLAVTHTVSAALSYVSDELPKAVEEEGGGHGAGYVIVHFGEVATWLLIHWWAHQDICLSMLAAAGVNDSVFKSMDHRRFHACIWEQKVISHESEAWIRTLSCPNPDIGGYLGDVLRDGNY